MNFRLDAILLVSLLFYTRLGSPNSPSKLPQIMFIKENSKSFYDTNETVLYFVYFVLF